MGVGHSADSWREVLAALSEADSTLAVHIWQEGASMAVPGGLVLAARTLQEALAER
ncbi:MAG: hypothetical protein KBB39_14295 [Phycicoccus sp.]|nr:hypothetical protein [Phycicoccus sp.]